MDNAFAMADFRSARDFFDQARRNGNGALIEIAAGMEQLSEALTRTADSATPPVHSTIILNAAYRRFFAVSQNSSIPTELEYFASGCMMFTAGLMRLLADQTPSQPY